MTAPKDKREVIDRIAVTIYDPDLARRFSLFCTLERRLKSNAAAEIMSRYLTEWEKQRTIKL